jgi:hypothetical protein
LPLSPSKKIPLLWPPQSSQLKQGVQQRREDYYSQPKDATKNGEKTSVLLRILHELMSAAFSFRFARQRSRRRPPPSTHDMVDFAIRTVREFRL